MRQLGGLVARWRAVAWSPDGARLASRAARGDDAPFLQVNHAGTLERNLATRLGGVTKHCAGVHLSVNTPRKIFETHSMDRFTPAEQEAASRAQAHLSNTARLHYRKMEAVRAAKESSAALARTLHDQPWRRLASDGGRALMKGASRRSSCV